MAEFILGSPLRGFARRHERVRKLLWRLDFALLWLIEKLLLALPVDTASRMGELIGRLIGPIMRKKSAIFRRNFAIAFPELDDAALDTLVRNAWGRAGRVLGEYPHLHTFFADPGRVQIEIKAPAAVFADPGNACVMVSAHLGNWEIIGSALAKLGIPNTSLYSPPSNPLLDKMLQDSRTALNCHLIPRDNSARTLMRALHRGRSVGAIMDRRIDEGHPVRFFGQHKLSTLMPAKLALKFNAELLPVEVQRLHGAHYKVIFHPPVQPAPSLTDETERAIDMTQQIHDHFEAWIRDNPQDWFCSKRMWPKVKTGKIEPLKENGHDADINSYAA
ncbi:MAG: lysophospholipid acyltransferase family protein [Gammaproteobacteria bacterium]|nr:lysophospholipid acyltransferase family protein [Gammaproteobacteria bacterium]